MSKHLQVTEFIRPYNMPLGRRFTVHRGHVGWYLSLMFDGIEVETHQYGSSDDDYLACYNDGHDWVHKE
jgi:hypothetical protein